MEKIVARRQMTLSSNGVQRVAEDELQAFSDGQLAPDQRPRVERYLETFPAERARVEAFQHQNVLLHRIFDWYMASPDPDRFDDLTLQYARASRKVLRLKAVLRAVTLGGVVAGSAALGWGGSVWVGGGNMNADNAAIRETRDLYPQPTRRSANNGIPVSRQERKIPGFPEQPDVQPHGGPPPPTGKPKVTNIMLKPQR